MRSAVSRTITVVATGDAAADVRVDARPGTTLADVLPRLRELTQADDECVRRNGEPVDPCLPVAALSDGDVVALCAPARDAPMHGRRDHDGDVVSPAPRLPRVEVPVRVVWPTLPTPPSQPRLPVLTAVAPLCAGVVLALLLRRWEFLAFAAMSPLMVLGQTGSDRWSARRDRARAVRAHAAAVAAAEEQLADVLAAETRNRHAAAPDLAALVQAACRRGGLLWQRGPDDRDFLQLRLGRGASAADVVVEGRPEPPVLRDVPICLDLTTTGVLGICGARDVVTGVARSLVVQSAVLHGPSTLSINVLAPGFGRCWSWARWLPHLRASRSDRSMLAVDDAQVGSRLAELAAAEHRHRLVVVDGLRDHSVAFALAARPRTSVIWLAATERELPAACTAVVTAVATVDADAPAHLSFRRAGAPSVAVRTESVGADVAEDTARALAPLRDGARNGALPSLLRWSQLYDVPLGGTDSDAAVADLRRRWARGPTTEVCLGLARHGPCVVDLRTDGPHALVAGTTGAGKSELLQSLVAGLAASSSPRDLSLLLIDFKGGAAFGPCVRLPHTVGVVTDFDPATTTRALRSLSAELRRREQLLATAGARDVDTWHATKHPDAPSAPAIPRLVIVVDEFATLAEQLPDVLDGLVGVARRGRSLGVHLVLATQRPEGAVSADIRANTRLRICLAVTRDVESRDVIDDPAAVDISRSTPGRAFVRIDGRDLVEVQAARVTLPPPASDAITVLPLRDWGDPPGDRIATDAPTELELLVDAAARAVAADTGHPAASIWLPPLPTVLPLGELRSKDPRRTPIGLVDLPDELCQPPLDIDPDVAEPLLVIGTSRSGRTTAVRTVVAALAAASSPDRLHVWAIDGGGGLADLARLPHTGAVVDAGDVDRVERLLDHLAAEVDRRRRHPEPSAPGLLLAVDGWESLASGDGMAEARSCHDVLLRLVGEGAASGLRVVVTSDRTGMTGRLAGSVTEKICLRLADHGDFALAGVRPRDVSPSLPPGRGVRVRDGALVQLARPDERTWRSACGWPPALTPPRRFDPLPTRVPLRSLPRPPAGRLVIGLGRDDLRPVVVDPIELGGSMLVAGPPRSGRTTALASIAAQLHDRAVFAVCAGNDSSWRDADTVTLASVLDTAGVEEAARAVATGAALLVDDVDLVDDPHVLDTLESAVRSARGGSGLVVLAGATDALLACFRGPVAQARRTRGGVVLHPQGPADGELIGLRLRRRRHLVDPPGRGVVAVRGRGVVVQVPDPS